MSASAVLLRLPERAIGRRALSWIHGIVATVALGALCSAIGVISGELKGSPEFGISILTGCVFDAIAEENMRMTRLLPLLLIWPAAAADLPGSKDPPLMKRYAGSEIIGYRSPKFDEFLLPWGKPPHLARRVYEKSKKVEGLMSRYTYGAPGGRTPAEVF